VLELVLVITRDSRVACVVTPAVSFSP